MLFHTDATLLASEIRNQKWLNKDATDVHQPRTVIQSHGTTL